MKQVLAFCVVIFGMLSCSAPQAPLPTSPSAEEIKAQKKADHKLFHATLRKHIKAVSSRDISTLESMMSPDGLMHLMRPSTEVVYSTDKYLKYHQSWFQDTNWTLESTITDSKVGKDIGMAVTEVMYKVPDRDGKPYWNQMTISYVLQKIEGNWYVISDHSSSVKKSTDKKSVG